MDDSTLSRHDGPLTSPENRIALYQILARQTERYLMGDSSSLPVETAGELFESIRFCLAFHAKTSPGDSGSLAEQFEAGQREVWQLTEDTKPLLLLAERTTIAAESQSYQGTLAELGQFFRRYDYRFFAHDVPCMIDYQLAVPVSEKLLGIEFIREYLTRLVIENRVAGAFDPRLVKGLLTACYADYSGLLVNLFEPVFLNAVGRFLLGREAFPLSISPLEREALFHMLRPWNEANANERVRSGAAKLSASLGISDAVSLRYLERCAEAFLPRLRAASPEGWSQLFLTI